MTFDEAITGEFKELFKEWAKQIYSLGYEAAKKDCIKIAEEATVITCKDCKHWGEDGYHNGCKYATCIMGEEDYCSMSERKE